MNPNITKEGQAAKDRIAEFRQNINNGATAKEARATLREIKAGPTVAPTATANEPITSTSLAPVTPMKLGTPSPATQATGMMAEFEDGTDSYTKNLEAQAKAKETKKTSALDEYLGGLESAKGLTTLTAESYAGEGGVDSITPELNDINDKIRREQLSMRRRVEAIQKNGGGLEMGANAEIGNIERESFAKQADLSIIQMAVQGRYDSAKEIADRAVAAKLEQQTNDLAIKKFNYEENKELYTKAEQRQFEAEQGNRERELAEEKENATAIYDLGLQAQLDGAPTAVVQRMFQAKTKEEAMSIGGSYLGALDRAAKNASIRSSNASAALNEAQLVKQQKIDAAIQNGELVLDETQRKEAYGLAKDFEAESKDFKTRVDAYNQIVASAENPSAAGDLSLIFGYMKMLDPNSVVRETEFANAENAAGVPERVRAQYNKALNGQRLTDSTRNDFLDRSTTLYNSSLEQQMALEDRYKVRATDLFNLPPQAADLVVQDIRAQGAVSDVVFGVQLENASDEQIADLVNRGLIPAK